MAGAAGVTIDLTQDDEDMGSTSQTAIMIDDSTASNGQVVTNSKARFTCFICSIKNGREALTCRDCDSRIHVACFVEQHGLTTLDNFRDTEICPGCQAIQISTMNALSPPVLARGSSSSLSSSFSRVNPIEMCDINDDDEEDEEEVHVKDEEGEGGEVVEEEEVDDDDDFEPVSRVKKGVPKKLRAQLSGSKPRAKAKAETKVRPKTMGGAETILPARPVIEEPPAPADTDSTPDAKEGNPRSLGSAVSSDCGGSTDSGDSRPCHQGASVGAGTDFVAVDVDAEGASNGSIKKRKRDGVEEETEAQRGWEREGETCVGSTSNHAPVTISSTSTISRGLQPSPAQEIATAAPLPSPLLLPPPPHLQHQQQKQSEASEAVPPAVTQAHKDGMEEEKQKEGEEREQAVEEEEEEEDGGSSDGDYRRCRYQDFG